MNCDKTLHVDSIHSKVCFCVIECGVVMATKSGYVDKGDNLVNKHFPDLFHQKKYTSSSNTALLLLSTTKLSPSVKRNLHLLVPCHYYCQLPPLRELAPSWSITFLPLFFLQIFITPRKMWLKQSAISGREVTR